MKLVSGHTAYSFMHKSVPFPSNVHTVLHTIIMSAVMAAWRISGEQNETRMWPGVAGGQENEINMKSWGRLINWRWLSVLSIR